MSIASPLSALTYYRMPDQNPAGTLVSDLLDAVYNALHSATDYRGTALPSTHSLVSLVNRRRPTVVTEAVDWSHPTFGSMTAKSIIAGRIVPAGTMWVDAATASILQAGINKNSGAYNDWTAAAPFTSGQFSGYICTSRATACAVATIVRAFISQEDVFLQIIEPTQTNQSWLRIGALVEPLTTDTVNDAEVDGRLYGLMSSGLTNAVAAAWLSSTAGGCFGAHGTSGGNPHSGIFTPGASAVMIGGGRGELGLGVAGAGSCQTASGVYCGRQMTWIKNTASLVPNGNMYGVLRNHFYAGSIQSGRYLRNGSTDLWHFISTDPTAAAGGFMLQAAA